MKSHRSPLARIFRLCFLASVFLLLFMGIVSKRGVLDLRRMLRENDALSNKLAALDLQKNELESQIQSFEKDRDERERVVRQVLGYIKPNETVIEFE